MQIPPFHNRDRRAPSESVPITSVKVFLQQCGLLLLGTVLLSLVFSGFHSNRRDIATLAEIRWCSPNSAQELEKDALRLDESLPSFEGQVEDLLNRFHGHEWILIPCESLACEKEWDQAKRLRRFGFPKIAIMQRE